jgi:protease I
MSKIAVPLADDFEDTEFSVPLDRLVSEDHEIVVIGDEAGSEVEGKRHRVTAEVDMTAEGIDPLDFDMLLIPGGHSPDHLRTNRAVVSFVRRFCESGRPVAAICHGPQLLIEADAVRGRRLTSWPSVRKDLENAGATWVDREVVEDRNLITSRKPDDLDAFCDAVLRALELRTSAPHTA